MTPWLTLFGLFWACNESKDTAEVEDTAQEEQEEEEQEEVDPDSSRSNGKGRALVHEGKVSGTL